MSGDFQVGDIVTFYGGQGTVIDIQTGESGDDLLVVLTENGETREISPSMPMVRRLEVGEAGDIVSFLGGEAEIISTREREERSDLLYLRTDAGDLKKIPADCEGLEPGLDIGERLATGQFDDPHRFSLRERAARLSLAYQSSRFLSLSGNRIRIEPYQVDAAHEILNAYEPRYLIGDEVGLGKTIEAGIVIEELIARDRAERVLIVTPASLRDQWQAEMRDKFGREYTVYDREYVDSLRRSSPPGRNVWAMEDRIVVSIDFAKQEDMLEPLQALTESWDVVVFDEAHHLTAREDGDGVSKVDRYNVGEAVADNTDALLFLTGTPHKGKPDQFYHLLRLLDPYRFRGPDDIRPEKLDDLMIRRLKQDTNMVDSTGERMFPDREIETLPVNFTDEERDLYEDITEYISAVYTASAETDSNAAGFTKVVYQKRLVSSIRAIRESLATRREDLEQKISIDDSIADRLTTVDRSADTEEDVLDQLIAAADAIDTDSKAARLRSFVDGVLEEDPDEKVLIFTEYTDTLEYLRDEVLVGHDTVCIHGGLDQEERRDRMETFERKASVMIATDAAREGLNLQFAHIMVNYDLPWNPIRIDQRMGRLHRYGQEEDVQVYNLFIEDTRESDILELLVDKVEQIESDLGTSSDVLGLVQDEYDVEGAIMSAVTGEQNTDTVREKIDRAVEERKEAVETIEEEFLIRDKFDASDREEIERLIDLSEERPIGEGDIEQLVRQFCAQFGGEVRNATSGPAPDEHPLYVVDVPDIIAMNGDISEQYRPVTFSRDTALEHPDAEFVSLTHPLVQRIIEYCLDGDWIDGQAAVLVGGEPEVTPGILATYRLGYVSGEGENPTEDYVRAYVTPDGTVRDRPPAIIGALPADAGTAHPQARTVAPDVDSGLEEARDRAQAEIEERVEEVRAERERNVETKEEHAERYFQQEIRKREERLREYEKEAQDTDKDMRVLIRSTQAEIENLEAEREAEFERLERERTVVPEEPELINAAVVVGDPPALPADGTAQEVLDRLLDGKIEGERLETVPPHAEHSGVTAFEHATGVPCFRAPDWPPEELSFESHYIDGEQVHVDTEIGSVTSETVATLRSLAGKLVEATGASLPVRVCASRRPIDAFRRDGVLYLNARLTSIVSEEYWPVAIARELAAADPDVPPERHLHRIATLLATMPDDLSLETAADEFGAGDSRPSEGRT